ncbi:MAG: hypothetical protein V4526_00950 [Patescibacteria group bacterium]
MNRPYNHRTFSPQGKLVLLGFAICFLSAWIWTVFAQANAAKSVRNTLPPVTPSNWVLWLEKFEPGIYEVQGTWWMGDSLDTNMIQLVLLNGPVKIELDHERREVSSIAQHNSQPKLVSLRRQPYFYGADEASGTNIFTGFAEVVVGKDGTNHLKTFRPFEPKK